MAMATVMAMVLAILMAMSWFPGLRLVQKGSNCYRITVFFLAAAAVATGADLQSQARNSVIIYSFENSSVEDANGLYMCLDGPDECVHINECFKLTSSFAMSSRGSVVKRWYLGSIPNINSQPTSNNLTTTGKESTNRRIFGAFEVSSHPLMTSTWKNLITKSDEAGITMQVVDLKSALEGANIDEISSLMIAGGRSGASAAALVSSLRSVAQVSLESWMLLTALQQQQQQQQQQYHYDMDDYRGFEDRVALLSFTQYDDRINYVDGLVITALITSSQCESLLITEDSYASTRCYEKVLDYLSLAITSTSASSSASTSTLTSTSTSPSNTNNLMDCFHKFIRGSLSSDHFIICFRDWTSLRLKLLHILPADGSLQVMKHTDHHDINMNTNNQDEASRLSKLHHGLDLIINYLGRGSTIGDHLLMEVDTYRTITNPFEYDNNYNNNNNTITVFISKAASAISETCSYLASSSKAATGFNVGENNIKFYYPLRSRYDKNNIFKGGEELITWACSFLTNEIRQLTHTLEGDNNIDMNNSNNNNINNNNYNNNNNNNNNDNNNNYYYHNNIVGRLIFHYWRDNFLSQFDQSMTIILNLLSLGDVEAAATHGIYLLTKYNYHHQYSIDQSDSRMNFTHIVNDELAQLVEDELIISQPWLVDILTALYNATDHSTMISHIIANSANIRASLIVYRYLSLSSHYRSQNPNDDDNANNEVINLIDISVMTANARVFGLFLNLLLQVSSPTVLAMSDWAVEAVLLRAIALDSLEKLTHLCEAKVITTPPSSSSSSSASSRCRLVDVPLSVGARGLFLLAYQGIPLLFPMFSLSPQRFPMLTDAYIVSRYDSFIALVSDQPRDNDTHDTNDSTSNIVTKKATTSTSGATVRLKIGFLSSFFYRHSVGRLLASVIMGLNTSEFDIYIVALGGQPAGNGDKDDNVGVDDLTLALQSFCMNRNPSYSHSAHWIPLRTTLSTRQLITKLRVLSLDILVYGDIYMDSATASLASHRVVPYQLAFWGHPYTSGFYQSMDYFISSDLFEPQRKYRDYRNHMFSEQLVLFDSLGFLMFPRAKSLSSSSPTTTTNGDDIYMNQLMASIKQDITKEINSSRSSNQSRDEARISILLRQLRRAKYLGWVLSLARDIYLHPVDAQAFLASFGNSSINDITSGDVAAASNLLAARNRVTDLHVIGAYQTIMKLHPLFDVALAEILLLDPHAVILLQLNRKQATWQRVLRERMIKYFTSRNISRRDYLHRVLFIDQMAHEQYARLVCNTDITLDTFPFGGGVTLTDSLLCDKQDFMDVDVEVEVDVEVDVEVNDVKQQGYSRMVPFVTSSALQTVHAIGSGISQLINHNNDNDDNNNNAAIIAVDSSLNPCEDKEEGDVQGEGEDMVTHNPSHGTTVTVQSSYQELHIKAYASAVVQLLSSAHQHQHQHQQEHQQERIRALLQSNVAVVEEWEQFFRLLGRSLGRD